MQESRLFKIVYHLLDKGRTTAPELADKFEVSVRTIYRDIDALSGAGIPIYTEPGRNGGICLLHDFVLDRAILSENEKLEILTAIQSIFATGYTGGTEMLSKLSALFHVHTKDWLEVDFSRWGDHPYDKSKEWYLKAFCKEKQDFRIFKLNRILEMKLLENTFVPRPYPEERNNLQQEYPQVVLLFSKEIAYRVYDEFDETEIEYKKNGDLAVCARMPVDPWLIGYLLSFGAQVEIIEPQYLKGILAAQAQKIYNKNIFTFILFL